MHRSVVVLLIVVLVASPMFAAKIPRPAPDLAVSLPNGQKLNLGSFKGKVVALEFLLTTCPGCKRTSQTMQKLYQEYA
ncbi:MAG: redoxin domain-containing protein, partial [bacterium]|nr:redoxin domain-containing protein [bacterium]